ncbi:MAG: gliding motility lipoprotein GldH [Chitinophagales bacterium]|nr:gliding motility lipoprotein GldH [Chitinophagales bacterium]
MANRFIFLTFFSALLFLFTACNRDRLYETNIDIPSKGWDYRDSLKFEVTIPDSLTHYNFILNIRHRDVYEWQNLYVKLHTIFPDKSMETKEINLPLCDDAGAWYGDCTGDICFARVFIKERRRFPMTGKYTFILEQDMRTNPLQNVFAMGMRIEESAKKQP